jgi:imidazoleglycerol-phosphate dehydratase
MELMRQSHITRQTKETNIAITLNLDGTGTYDIQTSLPFLSHMFELFARHGFFDLTVNASGDIDVDGHHLAEDLGIVLGQAFSEALGDKKGITRYGSHITPMDESLVLVALDISNRAYLDYDVVFEHGLHQFDVALIKEFFSAFVNHSGITLHIKMLSGDNAHHIIEAIFKGLAKALATGVSLNPRETGVPSTKGML